MNKEIQPGKSNLTGFPESKQETATNIPQPIFQVDHPDRPTFRPDPNLQEEKDVGNVRRLFEALNKQELASSQQPPDFDDQVTSPVPSNRMEKLQRFFRDVKRTIKQMIS